MASATAPLPSLRLAAAPCSFPRPRFSSVFLSSPAKSSSCIFASAEEINMKKCMSAQAVQHPGKQFGCAQRGILQQILTIPSILNPAAPANALEQTGNVPQPELEKIMQQFLFLEDIDPTTAKLLISITGPFLSGFGFLFILRIVMSWYPKLPVGEFPYVIAYAPTEPILKATRRLIRPVGGVDVTPCSLVWHSKFLE